MGRFRLLRLGSVALKESIHAVKRPCVRLHVPIVPPRVQIVWQAEGAH